MADFDFDFRLEDVYMGAVHLAARSAVLWPLVCRRGYKSPGVQEAYHRLRTQWHARLDRLKQAGWNVMGEGKHAAVRQVLRNCPPFGVKTADTSWVCHRHRVCPFCYARDAVYPAYESLEWALETNLRKRHAAVRVITITETIEPLALGTLNTWTATATLIRDSGLRWLEDHAVNVVGAVSQVRFAAMASANTFGVTVVGVYIVAADSVRHLPDSTGAKSVSIQKIDKSLRTFLAKLVGENFTYPFGMMRGDATTTVAILHHLAAHRPRLLNMIGVCNSRGPRTLARMLEHQPQTIGDQ